MKTIINTINRNLIIAVAMLMSMSTFAQGINYQGVARDAEGDLIIDTEITLDLNINKITADGETMYSETHILSTDINGVFSLVIGQGTPSLNLFEDINWAEGQHFLNVWLDGTEIGTTQFAAVPYTQAIGKWQAHKNGVMPVGTAGSIYIGEDAGSSELFDVYKANIGFGYGALGSNTEGFGNVAMGHETLKENEVGNANIALGANALYHNIDSDYNIAIGQQALYENISGMQNIALGKEALRNNTEGSHNIALGENTLENVDTGIDNIGIGSHALNNNSGSKNIAIGDDAGLNNIMGNGNVFIGSKAGENELGAQKLYIENTGSASPLIYGDFAANILNFTAKVGIGTQSPEVPLQIVTGTDASLNNDSGQLLLGEINGDNLVIDKNEIQARDNGAASILFLQQNGGDVYVGNAIVHASDKRLKRDIENLTYGLNDILKLRPTEYFWKGRTQDHKSLGLIAQEVDEVIENVVTYDEKQDKYGVSYTELIPVLIKAIQQQQAIIDVQQKRNNRQSKDMADLESRLEQIELKLLQSN